MLNSDKGAIPCQFIKMWILD